MWTGYLQGVQVGISEYFLQRPNWIWVPMNPSPGFTSRMIHEKPTGVIAFVEEPYREELRQLGVPVVDVSNWLPVATFPRVVPDDEAIGRLAAHYLVDLGLRHFAVAGIRPPFFARLRIKGFTEALAAHGFTVHSPESEESYISLRFPGWEEAKGAAAPASPLGLDPKAIQWLQSLPKPVGIFATNDSSAMPILDNCRHAGLRVPEDICLLGVDNDELITKVTHPPLSSIALSTEKIGFEAARLLDRLIAGEVAPTDPVLLPPSGVVTRQSSNLLAITDPDVQTAVRFIREKIHTRPSVEDLLKVVPLNRRYLERKFRAHLGRSPLQEICRVRIETAKELLSATDLSMAAIARRSGFPNAERLASVFHAAVGATPTAYRRSFRLKD
jgi:LacI family transcriptional regulator